MSANETATALDALLPRLIEIRHALHARPELSGAETWTSAYVGEILARLELDTLRTGVGGHGIVAEIRGARAGRTVALRADMDALPVTEEPGAPYCSTTPGVMHACGHDGHTTILIGVAHILARRRKDFAGTVRLLFQPAEETVKGAEALCADGAMDGVDRVFALHGCTKLAAANIDTTTWPQPSP